MIGAEIVLYTIIYCNRIDKLAKRRRSVRKPARDHLEKCLMDTVMYGILGNPLQEDDGA